MPKREITTEDALRMMRKMEKLVSSGGGSGGGIAQETDPTVPSWAKQSSKPTYTAAEVGADVAGSASQALVDAKAYTEQEISKHNTATDAHNDLRIFITELSDRVNALADSDDTTLDQMSEIVAYIKNNRELVEQVTTEKVSVTDIIDNLTTNLSNKVLSASMGVYLKQLIDAIVIPTKVSAFENDAGYLKKTNLLDYIYPVGSIYMSANNVSPETFLGGTWTQLQDRFLIGAGSITAGKTGGSETHSHTLENGYAKVLIQTAAATIRIARYTAKYASNYVANLAAKASSASSDLSYGTALGGSTDSESNMPPYLAVYMWKRTA